MQNYSLSLAQINLTLGAPERNLLHAMDYIKQAAADGSQLILFPELWSSAYDLSRAAVHAQTNQMILAELTKQAQQYHLAVGGSLLESSQDHSYNTFYLILPDGQILGHYRKLHLFRLMDEDRWLTPGEHPQIIDLPIGKTGLAICYDLRFPELFRNYALQQTVCFLLCAEWPSTRLHHWETLLTARAIENQSFFAAVNTVGKIGSETFAGCSMVLSPWGDVLIRGSSTDEELLTCTLNPELIDQARSRLPVFTDRRPDIYG